MSSPGQPGGGAGYTGGSAGSAPHAPQGATSPALAAEVQNLERAIFEVKRIIVGQDRLVERILVGLLAKGHVLLEGVPGVAKTLAVETFAKVVGGTFSRIQFTPDLVPTDIIGTRIYRQGREEFDTELGPVVANFLLADEINRAPAKVQSALLEVMAERKISIGGKDYHLPKPFLVMATQNPIENEGVYPLPEAQRDRFLFKINVDYPTVEEEREIIYRMGVTPRSPSRSCRPRRCCACRTWRPIISCTTLWSTTWSGSSRPPAIRLSSVSVMSPTGSLTVPAPVLRWASSPRHAHWHWYVGVTTSFRRTSSR
ncbi:AAA domain family protein [Mycobacteroides abscessus MAB_082312_2258]|nr:AAA domain family protein [Mycobacteroides abscessus MAB_082312_2258]